MTWWDGALIVGGFLAGALTAYCSLVVYFFIQELRDMEHWPSPR